MHPKAFLSHSSADKEVVRKLATDLRAAGVDAWFDEWEIRPGDSIVDKINSGIQGCNVFIIVVSRSSVVSRWVREELNAAVVLRIQQEAKIIPVRLDDAVVPPLLNSLHYVDLNNYDMGMKRLLDAILERDSRPPLGSPATAAPAPLANPFNLSDSAVRAAEILFSLDKTGLPATLYDANQVLSALEMEQTEAEDAIMELNELGLAEVQRYIGGALIGPTYRTPFALIGKIGYDPEQDVLVVAKAVASQPSWILGQQLLQATALDVARLNRAVRVMEERNLVEVLKAIGSAPFGFVQVRSTYSTRKYVKDNT